MKKIILFLMVFLAIQMADAAIIFSDDFESGALSGWNLSSASGASNWTASTTNPYQGSYHAQSQPLSTTQPASILERNVPTTGYQNITLSYVRRLVGIDAADEFNVTWYNGTTWFVLENTGGSSANDAGYLNRSYNLSSSAFNNSNFKIRFECTAGATSEYCRVDNVLIIGNLIAEDNTNPLVFSLVPEQNSEFNLSNIIEIAVNVTDESPISSVIANISFPNSSVRQIKLENTAGNKYNASFSISSNLIGRYNITFIANDSLNNINSSEKTFFIVNDVSPPIFSNLTQTPQNGTSYAEFQKYEFNITFIDNIRIDKVFIEFGGVNYSVINATGNIYMFNMTNLAAGVYSYYWWANDSSGNSNKTSLQYFAISKASQTALLNINESSPITYGTLINVTCNGELFRNEINVSGEKGKSVLLGAENYNYSCKLYEAQNYSYDDDNSTFIVNKASTTTSVLTAPISPITYGTTSNFSCSNSAGLITNLYINGIDGSGEKGLSIIRGAGNYLVNCTFFGNENYTGSSYQESYIVNKVTQSIMPLLNGINNNLAVVYPQQINASYSGNNQTALSISINGTNVNIGKNYTWGAGGWLVNYSSSENQNYSAYNGYLNLTIAPALSSVFLYLNHTRAYINITTGEVIAINATREIGEGIIQILKDGVVINTGNSPLYNLTNFTSLGYFNITAYYPVTQNYSASSETWFVNVTSPADIVPPYFITIPIDETINYTQGFGVDFDASDETAFGSYRINWTTHFSVNNSGFLQNITQLAAGVYKINITINDSSNNLNSSIYTLMVNKRASICTISSNTPQEYPTPINVSGSCNNLEAMAILYRDNINVNNENGINKILGTGTYNYIINVSESQNWTNASISTSVTVVQNNSYVLTIGIAPLVEVIYPNETSATGIGCPAELTCNLYRDNVGKTNPEIITLGAGSYNYSYNVTGNANYSSKSVMASLIVSKGIGQIGLLLNGEAGNITIAYPAQVNASAESQTGQIVTLYRNGIDITAQNHLSKNLGAGDYNFTAIASENTNYSSVTIARWGHITKAVSQVATFINHSRNNASIYQGTSLYLNSSLLTGEGKIKLYLNGEIINEGNSPLANLTNFSSLGLFNITTIYEETENYSASFETFWVNVIQIPDTIFPLVSIVMPQNTSYNSVQTQINYTVFDTNLQSCWYTLNSGITNISILCGANITGLTSFQGSNTWSIYANDSAGNVNSSGISFFVDSIAPQITYGLNTPLNNSVLAQNSIFINVSVSEINEANITFRLYNTSSIINETTYTTAQRTINFTNLADGAYFYKVSIRDILNNENTTEVRTVRVDTTAPFIEIISPIEGTYKNNSVLINISSNGVYTWFFNGTGNESYISPVYRAFIEGENTFYAYTNNSAGIRTSASLTFFINTLVLECEVGGPYQQGALVLVQGSFRNESSYLDNKQINLTIYRNNNINTSKTIITSNGRFETGFYNLSSGNYLLNASASNNGINESCSDNFEVGSAASLIVDKIATIHNISGEQIYYNMTIRIINKGGSDALNVTLADLNLQETPYYFRTISPSQYKEISYLLNLTRQAQISYYEASKAMASGTDSYTGFMLFANSTALNLTVPAVSAGKQIIITKNIIYTSETSLNVSYNVSSVLYNTGDSDLTSINYIDADISPLAILLNLSVLSSQQFSNIITIAKAASNIEHEFALGAATIDSLVFYSNRPKINIPGYGGPADLIVYAPASVFASEEFSAIIEIKNINLDIGQDFVLEYWISDETMNYSFGQMTLYVGANSSINTSVILMAPANVGGHKLWGIVKWAGGSASAFDAFEVVQREEGVAPSPAPEEESIDRGIPTILPKSEEGNETVSEIEGEKGQEKEGEGKPEERPEEPKRSPLTGFLINLPETIKWIINENILFALIILIILIIISIMSFIRFLRKKHKKKDVTRLKSIIGARVYSTNGVEIGRIEEVFIEGFKVHSLKIKLNKKFAKNKLLKDKFENSRVETNYSNLSSEKNKFKLRGIIINYRYVEAIKDIAIINEKILEKIQNG